MIKYALYTYKKEDDVLINLNTSNFSGRVINNSIVKGGAIIVTVRQKVANTLNTDFKVYISKAIASNFAESGISAGDEVLVINALMYQKDDEFRFKVEKMSQLIKLTPSIEDMFRGEELAKEKFI